MEVVHPRCCGLDVHQKTVVACRKTIGLDGKRESTVRTFGTMTRDLLELSDWLAEGQVTHVAMESTGVLWKPVWNLLEGRFSILLVNAYHIKQVPGRKTDVKDCEWIADLLQHGLLRASFVPPPPIRELRDLTRTRAQLVAEKTAVANRIHKVLEDANVKLGAVASDILGVSGREMLAAIVKGEQRSKALAELARGRLRAKLPELHLALQGRVTEHHRFLLQLLLQHLTQLESLIGGLDRRLEEQTRPFAREIDLLQSVPGIQTRTAENVLAEIGPSMSAFPSAAHLASWTGICPGNHESAGKRRTGKTAGGSRWLKRALTEAAWAAARTKGTYAQAQYRRLAPRRGKKRALVAVAHSLLIAIYHMLKHGVKYQDLGPNHFDRLNPEQLVKYLVKRLNHLGFDVTLEAQMPAA